MYFVICEPLVQFGLSTSGSIPMGANTPTSSCPIVTFEWSISGLRKLVRSRKRLSHTYILLDFRVDFRVHESQAPRRVDRDTGHPVPGPVHGEEAFSRLFKQTNNLNCKAARHDIRERNRFASIKKLSPRSLAPTSLPDGWLPSGGQRSHHRAFRWIL